MPGTAASGSRHGDGVIFLVHSETNSGSIIQNLGVSEYSYYFVLKEFRPLLEQIGVVVAVSDPENEVDRIWHNARQHGEHCVFLTFSPPHRSFTPAHCPTIPIFAWEFDTLPNESWNDDPRHDWRTVLHRTGRAITHSHFAVATVQAAMGADYPVISLPAPVWDRFARVFHAKAGSAVVHAASIAVRGRIFDTRQMDLTPFTPIENRRHGSAPLPWGGTREQLQVLELDGVIYTSVFCPLDGRKNFFDMIAAFCWALRDAEDATLVLKLTHHDCDLPIRAVLGELAKLPPFRCRIVMVDGYLADNAYMELAELSTYTVNTSHGEGQCLPLMEYMSAGKPAIAPAHTAMADYINPGNAFILKSDLEPTIWPHDPREAMRTRRHRIDFESLLTAYQESYDVAKHDQARYAMMSAAAHHDLQGHCSRAKILAALEDFLLPQPVLA
jgi:glycosyltransferase involved in cell wall biosynthesis